MKTTMSFCLGALCAFILCKEACAQPLPSASTGNSATETNRVETADEFDLSGFPAVPVTREEKRIADVIRMSRTATATAHEELARYYLSKGEITRADAEKAKAQRLKTFASVENSRASQTTNNASVQAPSTFTGKFYGFQNGAQHQWEFAPDGTFLHRIIASGSGTNVGTSERGTFTLMGDHLEVRVKKSTTAYATPSVGGRSSTLGSGTDEKESIQTMKLQLKGKNGEDGIVLDGMEMKVKRW